MDWLRKLPSREMLSFAIAISIILLIALLVAYCSPNDQQSYATAYQGSDDNNPWWSYPEAWTAIFTCALFVSTVGLWVVTGKSVEIANRALDDLERPWIFVTDSVADGIFNDVPFIHLKLNNYGRTVGEIRSIKAGVRYTAAADFEVGTIPVAGMPSSDVGNVVSPGEGPYTVTLHFPKPKVPNVQAFIAAGEYKFILRAEIHYTGLLKQPGSAVLCFVYDASKRMFVRCGGEAYNYTI